MYRILKNIPIYKATIPKPEEFGLTREIINDITKGAEIRKQKCLTITLLATLFCIVFCFYKEEPFGAFFCPVLVLPIYGLLKCYIYPERKDERIESINEYYTAWDQWWLEERWRVSIEKMQNEDFWTSKKNGISINKLANLFFANGYQVEEDSVGYLLLKKDEKNIVTFLSSPYLTYTLEYDNFFFKKYLENNDEMWIISLKKTNKELKDICKKHHIKLITPADLVTLAKTYCRKPSK